MHRSRFLRPFAAVLALSILGSHARAGFTNPFVPGFRGTLGTEYGAWETFTVAYGGPNLPDDPQSTAPGASLEQLVPGAFLTGGNIYHVTAATQFRVADSRPGDLREVVLQVSTWGAELHYASPVLTYVDGLGQSRNVAFTAHVELARYPAMGFNVESMYTWDLDSVADTISTYAITFEAAGPHLSLDALSLDTRWNGLGGTMVSYCHPGQDGVIACPCGNAPASVGRGCDNFGAHSGGAMLAGSGSAVLSADTYVLTSSGENATSLTIFLQSNAPGTNGLPFGAGVRCMTGGLKRIYTGNASGGVIARPGLADPSISARSAALGAPIQPGDTRAYMAYYRDPQAAAPCGSPTSNFNATQSGKLTWVP